MPFIDLDTEEKSQRLRFLWRKTFEKARGAVVLVEKLRFTQNKIKLLGSLPDAEDVKIR
jgi:hypothetical protein